VKNAPNDREERPRPQGWDRDCFSSKSSLGKLGTGPGQAVVALLSAGSGQASQRQRREEIADVTCE